MLNKSPAWKIKSDVSEYLLLVSVLPMGSSVDMLATRDPDAEEEEEEDTPIYEKYDHLLHGATRSKK